MFQIITIVAMVGIVAVSSMSLSSPNGLWQIMNMIQLFMLLVLLKTYLPIPIKHMINSGSYFSFYFSVPFVKKIYALSNFLKFIDSDPESSNLDPIEVESGSTFINMFSQLLLLVLVILIHLLVVFMRK